MYETNDLSSAWAQIQFFVSGDAEKTFMVFGRIVCGGCYDERILVVCHPFETASLETKIKIFIF